MEKLFESRKVVFIIFAGTALFLLFCCIFGLVIFSYYSKTRQTAVPPLIFPTRSATSEPGLVSPEITPTSGTTSELPAGKIVFVCQLYKLQAMDQICIINADGTGWQRLTNTDKFRSYYPSLAPDGKSIVYSSNVDGNFKLYEVNLVGDVKPIGNTIGIAPEISPDNKFIVYTNNDGRQDMIWVMNRDGSNHHLLYSPGWDPTWSPDNSQVLFATYIDDIPQLAIINIDGTGFHQITNLPLLRGRSDWSPDGNFIVTYSGKPWEREIILLNRDGKNMHQISPSGGNSQGPSFSPDGKWVAFTAYFGAINNNNGCEIYIMRIDGSGLRRVTNNSYCDWQPRWGQ